MLLSSPAALSAILFLISLLVALGASSWFTRRLENICDLLALPDSLLSLLGALGANIPNYAASIVALAHGQVAEGLGIIIGSNIYNVAIILAVSTYATSFSTGIRFNARQAGDARTVGWYTIAILCCTMGSVTMLSFIPTKISSLTLFPSDILIVIFTVLISVVTLGLFGGLSYHALRRTSHVQHTGYKQEVAPAFVLAERQKARVGSFRAFGGATLALLTALGSVVVMVNAGQSFANVVHMPPAILGLLVLAVATSLPNTVVAFLLARTGRGTACVEEVFSSNSINATLGIALPLLIWRDALHDPLLLLLDTPLMIALTLIALWCVQVHRVRHSVALLLFIGYVGWIIVHLIF
jgi:cation:H+ antiporter